MSRPYRLRLLSLVSGIVLGMCAFSYSALRQKDFHPEDFGLGLNTQTRIARLDGKLVSATGEEEQLGNLLPELRETFRERRQSGKRVALWLGASQLHAINRREQGDLIAVEYANEIASRQGSENFFLQVSSPNGNLHDLLTIYETFRQENLKPDWLIVALVFDDLREPALQKFLLPFLKAIDKGELDIAGLPLKEIEDARSNHDESKKKPQAVQRSVMEETSQDVLEQYLISWLNRIYPGYEYRGNLQAKAMVLGSSLISRAAIELSFIKHRTHAEDRQRYADIPEQLVRWNTGALEGILKLAAADGTRVLLYRQPIRPTGGAFYHSREQYDNFFKRVQELVNTSQGAYYLDIEGVVPQEFWGKTNLGEPDVFHFTSAGHKILAEQIAGFFMQVRQ